MGSVANTSMSAFVERLARIETLLANQFEKPLSLTEAAVYLNLTSSYVYKLTSQGKIKCFKPGGKRLFFKRSDLDAYAYQRPSATDAEIEDEAVARIARAGRGER